MSLRCWSDPWKPVCMFFRGWGLKKKWGEKSEGEQEKVLVGDNCGVLVRDLGFGVLGLAGVKFGLGS